MHLRTIEETAQRETGMLIRKGTVVVLYTRMASYFWDCLRTAVDQYGVQIEVVVESESKDAPIDFPTHRNIQVHRRETMSQQDLIRMTNADDVIGIVVMGWRDKEYLRSLKDCSAPVICGIDNPFTGNLRQWAGRIYAKFRLLKRMDYAWCAGRDAARLAAFIGFPSNRIATGLYAIAGADNRIAPLDDQSHEILYLGRFLDWKGVEDLAAAFISIPALHRQGWQLTFAGAGPLRQKLSEFADSHPDAIRIEGFVQPKDTLGRLGRSAVVCMPSWNEHWGVVLHEAAAAGRVLIASNEVHSGEQFLIDGYNGRIFPARDRDQLRSMLLWTFSQTPESRSIMGERSRKLAQRNSSELWAATLMSMLNSDKPCMS